MPRPLIKKVSEEKNTILSAAPVRTQKKIRQQNAAAVEQLLRKKRSAAYVKLLSHLDGGQATLASQMKDIIQQMEQECPEVHLPDILQGIVAKCNLGDPYEVHTLTLAGNIITHYKWGETLPDGLEKARNLAACGSYAFVEVYHDCCRAIGWDGSVSVVPG